MAVSPITSDVAQARFSARRVLLLSVLGAALVAAVGWYLLRQAETTTDADYVQLVADYNARFGPVGSLNPEHYKDADGDLIADLPSDKSAWLRPRELVFTGIIYDAPTEAEEIWKPLMNHLSKATGLTVRYDVELSSVDAQLVALRNRQLHVTAFTTGSVPTAVASAGFVPVCVPADENGKYAYQMEILVPTTSAVQAPADLKGRRVTFSNMSSNAGMKAPIFLLREQFGLHLGKDYSFDISGGYVHSLHGIRKGRVEAAPIANDVLRREIARGTIGEGEFRSIYRSESFPPLCFGHPHNLDPELAARLREGFLNFSWKGTTVEKEYAPAGLAKFVPLDYRRDWSLVRSVDEGMMRWAKSAR